jgi:predicted RNase H-like nuclease (RuvC/YqgF family)
MNESKFKDIYIKALEREILEKEKRIADLEAALEGEKQTVKSLRRSAG